MFETMNSIEDPLQANEMLKSATIYRNSEYNYVYVCYHCECSFTNILQTLSHVESHFDSKDEAKVNFANSVGRSVSPCEPGGSKYLERDWLTGKVNGMLASESNEPPGKVEIEYTIVDYQHSEADTKTESKNPLMSCTLCDRKFDAVPPLIVHMMKDHASATTLTCPHCAQSKIDKTTFERHLQQHLDANDTTCDTLIEQMKAKCVVHRSPDRPSKYEKKGSKICDICSSAFPTKKKLIAHMRQRHIQRPQVKTALFDCDKCERKIEGRFAFYAHQYGHLINEDPLNATNDDHLQTSLKKYLDDSTCYDESTLTYGCRICNQITNKRRYSAQLHIMQQHIYMIKQGKKAKNLACEYCDRKFASLHNLRVHNRTHTLEKPYTCSVCNKSFSNSSYMKYHEKIHQNLHPYQCPICGRTFRMNNKLNFHLTHMHANNTTKCPICDKELKKHRLKLHIRNVHENEHRPYTCDVCLQAFKTRKTLRTHSYRHSDVKQFECRHHCNERFWSSSSRRAHERSKHEAP